MSNERREWLVSFAPLKYCLFITSMYGVCKMPVGKVLLCFRYQHAERQRASLHSLSSALDSTLPNVQVDAWELGRSAETNIDCTCLAMNKALCDCAQRGEGICTVIPTYKLTLDQTARSIELSWKKRKRNKNRDRD